MNSMPASLTKSPALLSTFLIGTAALLFLSVVSHADEQMAAQEKLKAKGKAVYQAKCAVCHGSAGQGTDDYPIALTGDKSVRELTAVIDKTMPDGEPEQCIGADAEAVSAYIHDAFYSLIAQARNRPATVDFSRLTVRQFDNAITDLIGTFSWNAKIPHEHGLKAEYYNLRSFKKEKQIYERVDATVNFDFEDKKPEGFPAEPDMEKRRKDDIHDDAEFSIRWRGSLVVPETGDYEFNVESENGVRFSLNSNEPLIDAWVSSGNDKNHRGRIHLLGGRIYPVRLEFFRYKQKTASVRLKWTRPHHVEEVIPQRFLSPDSAPELFILNTPFPPDDRSLGYERGSSVSKGWQDAVVQASLETSQWVVDHLNRLAGIGDKDPDEKRKEKVRSFCERFVQTAFRRPLSDADKQRYVIDPLENVTAETGVKRVALLALMSPEFLYREHGRGHFDGYATASWLSFALWDSIPDKTLLEVARKNELRTRDQIARQVDRMLGDPRTQAKVMVFFHQWLLLDRMPELIKDQKMHSGFDAALVSDLRTSLDLFLEDVWTSENADFRRFFLDDTLFVNQRLAEFYQAKTKPHSNFEKVSFADENRAGVLTHPLLLAGFAYDQETSPIHRGVFIARGILGRRLKPPPVAVAPLAPDLHADLTTRARVLLQTSPNACQTCHVMINDLGFSLEHFDAAGRYRQKDKQQPINSKGTYLDRAGEAVSFIDSQELSSYLADSREVHDAFVEQLFQYTTKQPIRAFGPDEVSRLRKSFADEKFNIRKLLKEIVVSSALNMQRLESTEPHSTTAK